MHLYDQNHPKHCINQPLTQYYGHKLAHRAHHKLAYQIRLLTTPAHSPINIRAEVAVLDYQKFIDTFEARMAQTMAPEVPPSHRLMIY